MGLKRNSFTPDLKSFTTALVNFTHYQHFIGWQTKQSRESIQRSLELLDKKGFKDQFGTGTALAITDILNPSKWVHRASAGGRLTSGDALLRMGDEMQRRFNALLLVSLQSLHGKELLVLPDLRTVDNCLEAVASFGFGIYVLLSERCKMKLEYNYFKRTDH